MNVVVTGGAGYIGGVVAAELVRAGHRVVVVDNLSTGHRAAVPSGARFVGADLRDRALVRGALRGADAVVHLAGSSIVAESVAHPERYWENNVVAGRALLGAMREEGVRSLVFSSSAAVYGESNGHPIDEAHPTLPTNPYGASKLAFETDLRDEFTATGLRSICLRYFNAAGASDTHGEDHEPETHLIPLVLEVAAEKRSEVVVFGGDYPTPDGTCVRDYVHVLDLAHAHVLALAAVGHASWIAYNLGGGGEGHSVRQVIDAAGRVTGRPIPIRVGPRRAGDPARLVASAARIGSALGWHPTRSLDGMIGSAWSWARREKCRVER